MKREREHHREAFEMFCSTDRNVRMVAERFGVTVNAVKQWATAFAWVERHEARVLEANRRSETASITELQQRLEDHRKAGELLRRRGVEHLLKHPIETSRDAVAAIKVGIELERLSVGLPNWVFDVLRMSDEQLEAERVNLIKLAASEVGLSAPPFDLGLDEATGGDAGDEPTT